LGTSKLQEKPSALKTEHPALKNMKFLNFFYFGGSFLPSWIRIRIPDSDPLTGYETLVRIIMADWWL
jgi:hypothetical protein